MDFLSYCKHSELKTYFKNEYRDDWQYAYSNYINEVTDSRKNIFKTLISSFFNVSRGN